MHVGNLLKFQNNQIYLLFEGLIFSLFFLKFENRQSGHFSTDGSISPIGYPAAFS